MSPHAVSPGDVCPSERLPARALGSGDIHANRMSTSLLQRYDEGEVHDLVCVGFGPAALAIAVALHDALESESATLRTDAPKVRFLERQPRFAWHAGMLLPGAKMQITFIKDLATLRNPRSGFTFLNYLHRKGRLVSFTNLGTFLPQRVEYEDYLRWCAQHFDEVVDYRADVQSVHVGRRNKHDGRVETFVVRSVDQTTGEESVLQTKHVVVAVGGRPSIPACLPSNHPKILHSSQYATKASDLFSSGQPPRSVAVIGAGQSAAEVFHNVPSRFPGARASLIIRGAALRPSDESPFVNEVFDPEKVDDFYGMDPNVREKAISLDRGTNYGVVRRELLEELYTNLYSQRIVQPSGIDVPIQILNHRTVTGAEDCEVGGRSMIRLHIRDESGDYSKVHASKNDTLDVDLVVVASGYVRNAHEYMLKDLATLMPGDRSRAKLCTVGRDYGVEFKDGAISEDAGVWLQGCNEDTHGLSDTLLSVLANRGGEMVESIFGSQRERRPAMQDGYANGARH